MSREQAPPYLGELEYERRPERGMFAHRLGAKVLSLTLAGGSSPLSHVVPEGLPSFESYLATKYPELSPTARTELVQRFNELADRHGIARSRTAVEHRRLQR